MPYIAIKSFPKDERTKQEVAKKIYDLFLEVWGCPPEAISVSIEEVPPAEWQENVVKQEIEPNKDKMFILSGKQAF